MSSLNTILTSLVQRTNDFCVLCHDDMKKNKIFIDDEIIFNENNLQLSEVLSYILGDQVINLPMDTFCNTCVANALKCFSFLKMCNENMKQLSTIVDNLNNILADKHLEFQCKTLFVLFDANNLEVEKHFDNKKPIRTTSAAIKRLYSLFTEKTVCWTKYVKMENNEVTPVFECNRCQRMFHSQNDMKKHIIRTHGPKDYKCDKCPRSYGSQKLLEQHVSKSHCTAICSHCGKIFHNQHTLRMHELGHKVKIICNACGRNYKNKNTFRTHIDLGICGSKTRRSPSQAQFTCDLCKKKYTQKHSLRVHMKFEHGDGKAHVCKWCDKKFSCPSRLNAHTVKHTRERNFVCDLCGGKFVTKEALLYHTRIHTGETPYSCEFCEQRFLSASRRSDHVRRHHMEPSFQCSTCTKKFRRKTDLTKHKIKHEINVNSRGVLN